MPWFRRHRGVDRGPRRPTTEEILADLRDPLPLGPLLWGFPTRCPRCDDWGYIDRLDLVGRVMQLHCPTCRDHWEITEAQIDAARSRARQQRTGDDG